MRPRLAVLDHASCKPKKCSYECISVCPVNKSGKAKAIDAETSSKSKPVIYEDACIGCGLCVRACPFEALFIINLPAELEEEAVHRYGVNRFKLYRLPVPKESEVVGIIGKNGSGKSTAVKILAGELRPNFGVPGRIEEWDEIAKRFRGSELQSYFKLMANGKIRAAHKIQHVDLVPRKVKGTVGELLERADERGVARELAEEVGLRALWDRSVEVLSGGELQKLLIVATLSKDANVYIFDEPSSFLDVRERVRVAKLIRREARPGKFIIVVEHDLALLDYMSDHLHIIYGEPGAYGIVSLPYGVRSGINHYLDGYLPAENVRLWKEPVRFRPHGEQTSAERAERLVSWTELSVRVGDFQLTAEAGEIYRGQVIGIVGPNGIGKTTFVRVIAGQLAPQEGSVISMGGEISVAYKPQYVSPESFPPEATVLDVLRHSNPEAVTPGSWLYAELTKRMKLDKILDREARSLSGGELQKLALAAALAREADLYLLDEPSAYLDVEERLGAAKIIRRAVENRGAAALVVEHDIILSDLISDKIMTFYGEPGSRGVAGAPSRVKAGMNRLLSELSITIRRDVETGRPRVNKEGSYLDRAQKSKGEYYA